MAQLKDTTIDDAGFIKLPPGSTSERPSSPQNGMMRYNTDINKFEHYTGSGWEEVLLSQSSSLPSANFTKLASDKMPAGSILQIKSTVADSRIAVGTGNTSFVDLMSGSITPISSSSKIYVNAKIHAYYGHGSSDFNWYPVNLQLKKNGAGLYLGNSGDYTLASRHNGNAWRKMGQIRLMYIDSPNTTSSITYGIAGNSRNSIGRVDWHQYGNSELILMEIAG